MESATADTQGARPKRLEATTLCEAFQMTAAEFAEQPALRLKDNASLSRVEQIKRFELIEGEWAPGGEELTPTLELKRKPIERKYAAEIEVLYGG